MLASSTSVTVFRWYDVSLLTFSICFLPFPPQLLPHHLRTLSQAVTHTSTPAREDSNDGRM